MSTITRERPTLFHLLASYGGKLAKREQPSTLSTTPTTGRSLRSAVIPHDLPFQTWFVMELCTSGIAKVLSIVTNKELETVNSVRTLWFHYSHVGSRIIQRIYQRAEGLLKDDGDRTEAAIYLNWLGKLSSSYFVGDSPYEKPPEEYSQEIEEIIKDLIDIESRESAFISAAPYAMRYVNYSPGEFTYGYQEDDDLFELEMSSAQFVPCPTGEEDRYQPWDGNYSRPRQTQPTPLAGVPPNVNLENLPRRKTPQEIALLEEMEDEILACKGRVEPENHERFSEILSDFCQERSHKGAHAFLRLYKLSKILEDFGKHGKKALPVIDGTMPGPIKELLLLLGGELPVGSIAVGIPRVKDPGKAAVKKDPAVVETAVSTPEGSETGPPSRLVVRTVDPLAIKLNRKTKVPELFQEPLSKPVASKLSPRVRTHGHKHRRTISEWITGAVNARVDARAQTFSQTGRSRRSARIEATPRPLLVGTSNYFEDEDYSSSYGEEYNSIEYHRLNTN